MHRIVRLQISRLKSEHSVCSGMRPREAIIGETDDHIIDCICIRLRIALGLASSHKMTPLLIQHLPLLLRYGTAQQIRFTKRESSHP